MKLVVKIFILSLDNLVVISTDEVFEVMKLLRLFGGVGPGRVSYSPPPFTIWSYTL